MFGKQAQNIDVNALLVQVKEGERDRYKLDRIARYLTSCIQDDHNKFVIEKQEKEEGKEFYTFYYPFKLLDDDMQRIADIIEFDLPEEVQEQVADDYVYAEEWNRALKEKGDS